MEILRIAVCDDDVFALGMIEEAVKTVLQKRKIPGELRKFRTARSFEQAMEEKEFDLLLLDIDMPGTDGITLGRKLRENKKSIDIIYVSNREDKVFDSLKVNPFGFIRKSHFLEDVPSVLQLYLEQRNAGTVERLVLQKANQTISVEIQEILYIEGQRKYQLLYLLGKEEPEEIRYSMQELEEQLLEHGFLRVHKGYLVNYRHIRRFQENEVVLDDGSHVPLSRRKAQEVKEAYMEWMQNSGNLVLG